MNKRLLRYGLLTICILSLHNSLVSQTFHVGGTMVFTDYMERRCEVVFKEEGIPKDPFISMKEHGASMVRLTVSLPPYINSYSLDVPVDWAHKPAVFRNTDRAQTAGLETLLTFNYASVALDDAEKKNPYVAPLSWQPIADDLNKLSDSVYYFTYHTLEELAKNDRLPSIVSIGNETTYFMLTPNVEESELGEYDPERSVRLLNAGSKAVRDIADLYQKDIKVCFHMTTPAVTKWWLETHSPFDPDMDIIGLSIYFGWYQGDYAGYSSLGSYIEGISDLYGIELMVMETAQLFQLNGYDNHTDILGTENIPAGYPNPPTTHTQKQYMIDLTNEVKDAGGTGVIYWGGEWVGTDCYIFPDQWGRGSSWENKAFWDEDYNVHDGINWMQPFTGDNLVTFEVNMTGHDASNGVYIYGDIPDEDGITWNYMEMQPSGNMTYKLEIPLKSGSEGSYVFSTGVGEEYHENVPSDCASGMANFRSFEISSRLERNKHAFLWSSCSDELVLGPLFGQKDYIKLFPNPVPNKEISIVSGFQGELIVEVFNMSGRKVGQTCLTPRVKYEVQTLSMEGLEVGVYIVRIQGQYGKMAKETIILR